MVKFSTKLHSKTPLAFTLLIVLSLVFNSGIAYAANNRNEVGEPEECQASLVTLGEELWEHVPDLPQLRWNFGLPEKAKLLWNAFVVLLDSIFPGIIEVFPKVPELSWMLAWLPESWFGNDSLTSVPVISQASGTVIGLVPVVGPILDGTAIVTARDQITGECLSRMAQGVLLASTGATMVFPALLAVKAGLKVGKPLAKLLPEIPVDKVSKRLWDIVEDLKGRLGRNVSRLEEVNEVDGKYRKTLRIFGKGAISSDELATKLGLKTFTENNYREGLMRFTGRNSEEVQGLEAHHILPQEFRESFERAGVENIHDPRLLAWVDEESHRMWSHDYSEAWREFFIGNQNPTAEEILKEARELSREFDFSTNFEIAENWLPGWVRLPFQRD
ncbi:MAG: DUF2380 domain-containing protein [Caldilineaceae bacterium SB0664_bin_27]|uniref:DUF2380 domain-containing protein n=1 Tax=Caldilineaceae bacterium SB0664_bin_27 TaxID=2605260 RepID=A0A6B0YRA8_9CHLR|nr:DUF2380 domain-containing protein [Caldilineaceae bacterium SB0664_bin_27]